MSDGSIEEICALQGIGFELLAFTQEHIRADQGWRGVYFEFLVRKQQLR
jgi:hypothetical protein